MSPRSYPINCNRPLNDIIIKVMPGRKTAYLWQPYRYVDPEGDEHRIEPGVSTDTQSVPWFARWAVLRDIETLHASLPHDHTYETHDAPRMIADLRFFYTMLALGKGGLWASLYLVALGLNGWYAYHHFDERFRPDAMLGLLLTGLASLPFLVVIRMLIALRDARRFIVNRIRSIWSTPCDPEI